MSRILVDENIPQSTREWLRKKGFDITCVSDTTLRTAKDQTIAEYAVMNNMTILTLDSDFAQIYHTLKKGSLSVILIKANPSTASNILETLNTAFKKIDIRGTKNKLIIITKKRVRIIT